MHIGHFTAFYPSRPFWAGSGIDFDDPSSLEKFGDLMSEETYTYSNDIFAIKICRDGQIMIRVEALEKDDAPLGVLSDMEVTVKKWGEYLDYLNAFYLLLDCSVLKLMNLSYFSLHEITNRDAFRIRYENGKAAGYEIAAESITSVFQMGRFLATYGFTPVKHDPRISTRYVISLEAIENAVKDFELAVGQPGLEKVLASFTKSIAEYKVGNYETSIVLAWFISERIIADLWNGHLQSLNTDLDEGQKRINRKRQGYLTGRDLSVSLVLNLLELWGILPFALFKDVDKVRAFRNDIVHGESRYVPTAEDARLAIDTARDLFRRTTSIEFNPNLAYSVRGL